MYAGPYVARASKKLFVQIAIGCVQAVISEVQVVMLCMQAVILCVQVTMACMLTILRDFFLKFGEC